MPDPLCHRLSPLPRETSSEIGRHVEFIFVRLYRFYTVETIGSGAEKDRGFLIPVGPTLFEPGVSRGCGESNGDGLVACLAVVSDDTVFSGSDDCRIKVWGCALAE